MMDTAVSITVWSTSKKDAQEAVNAAFKEIGKLGELLDYYSDTSEITAINRMAGEKPVKVSTETFEVIERAVEIAHLTDGAYDPTIGPVIKLWDFVNKKKPDQSELKRNLAFVDYRKISLDRDHSTVFLIDKNMEIDLGGIAKGYGADRAIQVMKSKGIKAALVSIAGDIKGYGLKPNNQPWRIGIQNPRYDENSSDKAIIASFPLNGKATSTSGDYQRYFIEDSVRYHHLLNPQTGMPSKELISVSLIADEGIMADALSTGVFIMGIDKGVRLITSLGIEGVFVDKNNKIYITKGMKDKLTLFRKYSVLDVKP